MNPFEFSQLSTADLLDQLRNLDEDELRVAIILELVMRGDTSISEDLINILNDSKGVLQLTSIWALGEIGNTGAIQPLISILLYDDPDLIPPVIESLRKIGNPVVKPLIAAFSDSNEEECIILADALASIGSVASLEATLEAVLSSDEMVRAGAAIALGAFRVPQSIPILVQLCKDSDAFVQSSAAFGLQFAHDNEKAVDALLELLEHDEQLVVENAIISLGAINNERAIIPLINMMDASDTFIISTILTTLAEFRHESILPAISNFVDHPVDHLRQQSVVALIKLNSSEAVHIINERLLVERSPDVLQELGLAAGQFGNEESLTILKKMSTLPSGLMMARLQLGDTDAFHHYQKRIRSHDMENRLEAIWAFSGFKSPKAVPPLIAALLDGEWETRSEAATALGQLRAQKAIRPLIDILERDEMAVVRESAAYALGSIADPKALKKLIHILQYDDTDLVRAAAANALGSIGDIASLKPLIIACLDVSEIVRAAAATALGSIGDPQAVNSLKTLLDDDQIAPRVAATEALKILRQKLV